ncbi:hypothetical protein AAHC03_09065 [Spirometra sp. Aus1]
MSTALCDAFYHGVQSSKIICPKFCCGNQTFRFCCSDCNLHYPFDPVDCQALSDSSYIPMAAITGVLVAVAAILFIATSLRYTRVGQKLCFHVTGHRNYTETPLENVNQQGVQATIQRLSRPRNPRMSPYSLIPPSLLPPLPTYNDVTPDIPPPAFEEAPSSQTNIENMPIPSIFPLPQPAVLHGPEDPEGEPASQRPPPAYTSVSGPPPDIPPTDQLEHHHRR